MCDSAVAVAQRSKVSELDENMVNFSPERFKEAAVRREQEG